MSWFPAGFTPSPSSYISPVLLWHISHFLVSSQISNVAVVQTYPSYSSLHYYLCLSPSLHKVAELCCDRKLKRGMKSITPAMRGKPYSNKCYCTDRVQSQAGAAVQQLILKTFYYWRYDAWWCPPPTIESSYSITVFPITEFSGDGLIQGQCQNLSSERVCFNMGRLLSQ